MSDEIKDILQIAQEPEKSGAPEQTAEAHKEKEAPTRIKSARKETGGEQNTSSPKDEQPSHKNEEQPSQKKDEQPSLKEVIQEQAREDEETLTSSMTLRRILGGDFLTAGMIRKQVGVILIIVAFTIVYISNRYSCQRDLLEIDKLNKELLDAKYKALSSSSMLTEKCRESHVLEMLRNNKDSVLHIADQPPYIINVPEK